MSIPDSSTKRRIAVFLDQSSGSQNAIDWLTRSKLLQSISQVLLLSVSSLKSESDSLLGFLETASSKIKANHNGISITTKVESGAIAQELLNGAFDWQPDFVVVGTNDRKGLENLLLGSVSQKVVEGAHCPVIIARKSTSDVRNILVAVDNSECSAAALEWLSCQQWAREKNIIMLSVLAKLPSSFQNMATTAQASEMLLDQQLEESLAAALLENWSEMLAEKLGREIVPFAVTSGEAKEEIIKLATQLSCDLIVLGSHGRSELSKLLLGSVSQSVAVSAPCSVLITRGLVFEKFNSVRSIISQSNELALAKREKPHPARVSSSVTGTDMNGIFPNFSM